MFTFSDLISNLYDAATNINKFNSKSTILKTEVIKDGKVYPVHKAGNTYFYEVDGKLQPIDPKYNKELSKNKAQTLYIRDNKPSPNSNKPASKNEFATYNPEEARKQFGKPLNTKVIVNGKSYDVHKAGGSYFYYDPKSQTIKPIDRRWNSAIDKNLPQSLNIGVYQEPGTEPTHPGGNTDPNTTPETDVTPESNPGAGGGIAPYIPAAPADPVILGKLNQALAELEALKKPVVRSADELAKIYGIDYNEKNILNNYNDATNEYYANVIKEQNDLRNDYVRNNGQYLDNVTEAYLDSYRNAAPTATGKGTVAANTLSTQLNASQMNAANDYGMLQSVNNLEEAKKAELAKNPDLARQYYNRIGTYLSNLSANLNKSDVQQYVGDLDYYTKVYAADRGLQRDQAAAAANKYSGLANAQAIGANNAANSYNSRAQQFQRLWDYFYKTHNNNANFASNATHNALMNGSQKSGGGY